MNPYDIHDSRERALQEIAEGVHQEGISITIVAQDSEAHWYEGQCDADGDGISAEGESQFLQPVDEDNINIRFRRGVSRERIGRTLRKCAEMFDGPHGCELANLGNEPGHSFRAYRLPNGELYLSKNADDYWQYLRAIMAIGQTEVDVPAVIE